MNERLREIGNTIRTAMCKLDIDFTRESPAISEAESRLNEAVSQFVEGAASKLDVKSAYKTWVDAHKGGLF